MADRVTPTCPERWLFRAMPLPLVMTDSSEVIDADQTGRSTCREGPGGVGAGIALSPDAAEATRRVLQLLVHRLDMDLCLLSLRVGDDYVVLDAVDPLFGLQPGVLGAWSDALCSAMADGTGPRVAPDLRDVPVYQRLAERSGLPVRAYAGTPLFDADGQLLGSLCAFGVKPRGPALHDQYSLLSTFGLVLAHMLDRELTAQQARTAETAAITQARTDTLTGALNRRGWQGVLQETDRWCRVEGQQATVFVIDVDELKATNDREGHDAGDALLQRAASALTDAAILCSLRREELGLAASPTSYAVARTGGDEFAVLLTRFGPLEAPHIAQELRRALTDAGVSASLGFAMRHPVRGLALACRDADQLMLAEKRHRQSLRSIPVPRDGRASAHRAVSVVTTAALKAERDEAPAQEVGRLLSRVRELFGLESAFVSRFDDDQQTFTHINTSVPLPIAVGDQRPLAISLCQHVLAGRLPTVITDATTHPVSADIDVVRAGLVRAYLSVPLTLPNGSLYGTLCCLSASRRPDITEQAAAALAFAAEQVGELLGRQQEESAGRVAATARLDDLLATDGLRVALQPVVDLRTGQAVGAEALARFADGRTPDAWFDEAAQADQSERLEVAAFDAALGHVTARDTFLAVNLSPAVLMSKALRARLDRVVAEDPLRLRGLVIELTEHEQVSDYGALAAVMAPYRAHGLRLSVDDTGAGHSSLSHVLQLRPDMMKLDRQLITALDRDPIRRALVKSLGLFCADTQVDLIAEGVETAQEAEALRRIGVHLGQGFHLGRPAVPVRPA